MMLVIKNWI